MTFVPAFDDTTYLDRRTHRDDPRLWSDRSQYGMVAAAHYRATEAGLRILEGGGNAIDAAVATAFALGVVEPAGSGLGGMAMALVHSAVEGRTVAFAAPCRAPEQATPEAVASSPRYIGYRAIAVPTFVAAMETLLARFGTTPLPEILAPAIELAEDGFTLTPIQRDLIEEYARPLSRTAASDIFLEPARQVGRILQPTLARTLRRLARHGLRDFYEGGIAHRIDADLRRHHGFLTAADLAGVREIAGEAPLQDAFRGRVAATLGPPAGGRTLLQMLGLFDILAGDSFDADTPEGAELLAEIIRAARRDRLHFRLGPIEGIDADSPLRIRKVAHQIRHALAVRPGPASERMPPPKARRSSAKRGPGETSHISVMDRWGNAVALTQSIERSFGSKVVTPELGFLYNGYMKGFKIVAREHPHYLRPGAVARSNAAPTLLLDSEGVRVSIGSTGSERMLSGIFQTLVRLESQDPFDAVHAPRLHASPDSKLILEAERFTGATAARLRARGYELESTDPYSFKFGGLHLVTRDEDTFHGVAEPRRDGAAAGPRPSSREDAAAEPERSSGGGSVRSRSSARTGPRTRKTS